MPASQRDEDLTVEHGLARRSQKCPDEELLQRIPKNMYSQQEPVTYWTHNLERKNYYMSAGTGGNPFAKTSGMTQAADVTKSVKDYYGNINFEQEQSLHEDRKTMGKFA